MPRENPLLAQAAKDVPPDSSPGDDQDFDQENLGDATDDSDPAGGKQQGDQGGGQGKSGRTLENIQREFDRKIVKLEGIIEGLSSRLTQAPAAQQPITDVTAMSSVQLEALAGSIPEGQKQAFAELLAQKKQEESVRSIVTREMSEHNFQSKQMAANVEAFNRYPELHDQSSKFRIVTNQVLNEMGAASEKDPEILLHASEVAAARLGVSGRRQSSIYRTAVAGGGTGPADEGVKGASEISASKANEIAQRLARAMPGGKFSKERVDSARKASKIYRDNISLIRK